MLEALGAGDLELCLEDVPAIVLGLLEGLALVDEEDGHVARALRHERQLVVGHGSHDDLEDDALGALNRDLALALSVEGDDGVVPVRSARPREAKRWLDLERRDARRIALRDALRRRRQVGRRLGRARRVGAVGDADAERLGVRPDEDAEPDARGKHGTTTGDGRLVLALLGSFDGGLHAFVGGLVLLLGRGLSGGREEAGEVPVRRRGGEALGLVSDVARIVRVGPDEVVAERVDEIGPKIAGPAHARSVWASIGAFKSRCAPNMRPSIATSCAATERVASNGNVADGTATLPGGGRQPPQGVRRPLAAAARVLPAGNGRRQALARQWTTSLARRSQTPSGRGTR